MKNLALFVTGKRGSGKSTACRVALRILEARGIPCSGILCSSDRTPEGRPYRIVAEDVATGESRLLAERPIEGASDFAFCPESFSWAGSVLRSGVEASRFPLFLDEVGPLELVSKGGYFPFLAWLAQRGAGPIVIAVRSGLEAALRDVLDSAGPGLWRVESIVVREDNRDPIPQMIVDSLFRVADSTQCIYS